MQRVEENSKVCRFENLKSRIVRVLREQDFRINSPRPFFLRYFRKKRDQDPGRLIWIKIRTAP